MKSSPGVDCAATSANATKTLPTLLLLKHGTSGFAHLSDWSKNHEPVRNVSGSPGPPIRWPPQSGPTRDTVQIGVCNVYPTIAYHVFAWRRASSALNARVEPYAPRVALVCAATLMPTMLFCRFVACAGEISTADAPGRSS